MTIDFQGFTGAGFTNAPVDSTQGEALGDGALNSNDWSVATFEDSFVVNFNENSGAPNEFARGLSTDGTPDSGVYAFQTGEANIALGFRPEDDNVFDEGDFTLRLANETGASLSSFAVTYSVFDLNDRNMSTQLDFSFSRTDNASDFDDNTINALTHITDSDAATVPDWDETVLSTVINFGTPIADGEQFFLRWQGQTSVNDPIVDPLGDIVAIDNISITAVPEPSSLLALGAVSAFAARRYRRRKNS
ncbi:PEP-CTERM sorting domain-containing protein [Crateriforma conspicua]|uniref:PEP-CTERM sorting domain-containing protein n=1 Tax=Crateriforma conspicua TaxID=2527996 RepID=UPI0018CE45D4|nr:PEP-CTERM sorting domain-containing protein [Crateriforma conspicua]